MLVMVLCGIRVGQVDHHLEKGFDIKHRPVNKSYINRQKETSTQGAVSSWWVLFENNTQGLLMYFSKIIGMDLKRLILYHQSNDGISICQPLTSGTVARMCLLLYETKCNCKHLLVWIEAVFVWYVNSIHCQQLEDTLLWSICPSREDESGQRLASVLVALTSP